MPGNSNRRGVLHPGCWHSCRSNKFATRKCRYHLCGREYLGHFTLTEMKAALSSSSNSSSPGQDGITYDSLSNLTETTHLKLLQLYKYSWTTGIVPDTWKLSPGILILKPGKSPFCLSSCRPVALASCVGKLMDKIILFRTEWFLGKTSLSKYYDQISPRP